MVARTDVARPFAPLRAGAVIPPADAPDVERTLCSLAAPRMTCAQHGPTADQQSPGHGDNRRFFAARAARRQAYIHRSRPGVVTQTAPSAFDQQLTQQRRSTFGDATATIHFSRLKLPRHQPSIRRHLAGIAEAVRIVEIGRDDLGGPWTNTGN